MGAVKIYDTSLLRLTVLYMASRVLARTDGNEDDVNLRDVTIAVRRPRFEDLEDPTLRELAGKLRDLGVPNAAGVALHVSNQAAWAQERLKQEPTAMSVVTYDRLRRRVLSELGLVSFQGGQLWPPTSQTVIAQMHGSWNKAMQDCGLQAQERVRTTHVQTRFTPEDHRRALRDFVTHYRGMGVRPTYSRYTEWVRAQGRSDTPSGPLLRQVYGTWNKALALVDEDE
ncbi:MAG: hypothetical protein Q4P06_02630 [Actinomycetaceae bacterium]|nr:hypothetical protein [Actinomycetaceae bacterium]